MRGQYVTVMEAHPFANPQVDAKTIFVLPKALGQHALKAL
jgi:hypothetical protein